ncbi:hypothetical protein [Aestuariimicrobium sp. Y1814]|uniref:hypothetical protein n=1 Tax=Aestuariimicrobium sp. Y1814 TaxID=3418742 RepID=UPI003DA73257
MTSTRPPRRLHPGRIALVLLVGVDVAFIVLDLLLNVMGLNPLTSMQVHRDRSVPEFYQYIKLGWCIALVLLVGWAQRTWQPVFWAPLLFALLLTDAATVHEHLGGVIAEAWGLPAVAGLRPRDLGELVVALALVAPSLVLVALAWRRASRAARRFHVTIVSLLGLLAVFGLVFDLLHSATTNPRLDQVFAVLEDGGEMVAISAMLAFLVASAASGYRVWGGTLLHGLGVKRQPPPSLRSPASPPSVTSPRSMVSPR